MPPLPPSLAFRSPSCGRRLLSPRPTRAQVGVGSLPLQLGTRQPPSRPSPLLQHEEQHPAPYHRQQGPRLSVRWQAARVYGGLRRNAAGLSRHAVAPTWPSWPLMKHLCRTVVPAKHKSRDNDEGVQSFTAPRSVSDYNTCPGLAHARAPRCKRVRRIVASNHAAWALWMHLDSQFDAGGMVPLAATMIERLCQTSSAQRCIGQRMRFSALRCWAR